MSNTLFVVGNGPSLKETNLALIAGRESWAMNRIHLLYPYTPWRPTRWLWVDEAGHHIGDHYQEAVEQHFTRGYTCYVWEAFREKMDRLYGGAAYGPNIAYVQLCHQHMGMDVDSLPQPVDFGAPSLPRGKPTAWHLPSTVRYPEWQEDAIIHGGHWCKFGSGLFLWLQLGVWMGFNPIVLVGCDLHKGRVEAWDADHFDPQYEAAPSPHDQARTPERRNATLVYGHELSRAYAESQGVRILNATVGGLLDVYPRVSLEEVV